MAHMIRAQTVPGGAGGSQVFLHPPNGDIDVEYFEENDRKQYPSRSGSLNQVIREYGRNKSRRVVIFAQKNAFNGYQDNSFLPPRFWSVINEDLNGMFGLYHHDDDFANSGDASYDTWSTFKVKHTYQRDNYLTIDYHWSQISVLVRQSKNRQFILFVDCPSSVTKNITENLSRGAKGLKHIDDPFIWHTTLVEELRDVYDNAVWEMRHVIRNREKNRGYNGVLGNQKTAPSLYKPDITYLKEVARHLIHINEAFLVAGDTLESIMHHHVNYFRECERIEATTAVAVAPELAAGRQKLHSRIQERLYIANKEIRAIKSRASTLSERLDNEIDLYNHQLSIAIAESTRRDNATMQALTLIGVLYLPGTFISGIFGSNFFNYSPGSNGPDWNMSSKFWVYWAVTIPLTILTFLSWAVPGYMIKLWKQAVVRVKSSSIRARVSSAVSSSRKANDHTEEKIPQV